MLYVIVCNFHAASLFCSLGAAHTSPMPRNYVDVLPLASQQATEKNTRPLKGIPTALIPHSMGRATNESLICAWVILVISVIQCIKT